MCLRLLSVEDRAVNYLNSGISLIIVRKREREGNGGQNRDNSALIKCYKDKTHTHRRLSFNTFLDMPISPSFQNSLICLRDNIFMT